MLNLENERFLRELCKGVIPEERVDQIVEELTDEELARRIKRLWENINSAERRPSFGGRRFRR